MQKYVVDTTCKALDVAYGDAFYTQVRYILTSDPDNDTHSMLHVTADIAWAKSVMSVVRSMIVKSTFDGVEAQVGALDQAISAHLGEVPMDKGIAWARVVRNGLCICSAC